MYDKTLMSDKAVEFLTSECGMDNDSALKFLEEYKKAKEYEDLVLSMEIDTSVVDETLKNMREDISNLIENKKGK